MVQSLEDILKFECHIALFAVGLLALCQQVVLLTHAPLQQQVDQSNTRQRDELATKRDCVAHDVPRGVIRRIDLRGSQSRRVGDGDDQSDGH